MNFLNEFKLKYHDFKFWHMNTSPAWKAAYLQEKGGKVGKNVMLYTKLIGTEPYLICIHDDVNVAADVFFCNHDVSCFNMTRYLGLDNQLDKVGPIELWDNCMIGARSILMPGCSVGKNSVVAAGSVVTKHIPDNEVWGGYRPNL